MPDGRYLLPLLLLAGACKPPPEERQFMPVADPAKGKQAMANVGCGACHTITGVDWPQGKVAPHLRDFSSRALIAGRIPNTPENLASFIRNAPAVLPGTTMPPMPITQQQSRDIAAYLYESGH